MARQRKDSAAQIMQRLQFDPLKVLIDQGNALVKKDPHSRELRSLALQLMPYAHSQLKSVEHNAGEGSEVTITIGGKPPTVGDQDDAPDKVEQVH